jgi:hypothetical protein
MPKPDTIIDEEGNSVPRRFEIRKFYANIITIDEDEMCYSDMLLGIDGAQSRIFELMRRIR